MFGSAHDESGRMEVYVQPFPPTGAKWQVSTTGGGEPAWRADGRELYYMDLQRRIVAVQVESGSVFRHTPPVVLFRTAAAAGVGGGFEPAPDGRRFLVRELAAPPNPTPPMHVILNWPALVSVPASRPPRSP
jgi:hypothetical protein